MQALSISGQVLQILDAHESLVLALLRGPSCRSDALPLQGVRADSSFPECEAYLVGWYAFHPEQSLQGELGGWGDGLAAGSVPLLLALLLLVLLSARKPSAHTND